jgi:hypothetical protein
MFVHSALAALAETLAQHLSPIAYAAAIRSRIRCMQANCSVLLIYVTGNADDPTECKSEEISIMLEKVSTVNATLFVRFNQIIDSCSSNTQS